ncbi:uncharacterized, partial [Tachysurus ichikawai]
PVLQNTPTRAHGRTSGMCDDAARKNDVATPPSPRL